MTMATQAGPARSLIVALIVWALSTVAAEATILVGLRADDQIILGADSKVTGLGGPARPDTCKIHQGRRCFFALGGPIIGPGFNAVEMAREACSQGKDVDAILDGFLTRVAAPYKAMHDWVRRNESEYIVKRGPLFLEFFVIARRNGQPIMLRSGYAVNSVNEPMAKTEVKNGVALYSRARDLPRFVAQNPGWFHPPYARAAERLVEADMASGWVDVGPPVTVLQVDADGAKWFKPGLCPPIDPTLWSAE
jgi:hypothetical protein